MIHNIKKLFKKAVELISKPFVIFYEYSFKRDPFQILLKTSAIDYYVK